MQRNRVIAAAVGGIVIGTLIVAAPACRAKKNQKIEMIPTVHGGISKATDAMTLEFGRHGDPEDYSSSIVIDVGTRCSATLIGPRVLLTAAHCVSTGDKAYFKAAETDYSADCEPARAYRSITGKADWALCRVNEAEQVPGLTYDTISLSPDRLAVDKTLMLTGFGLKDDRVTREQPLFTIGPTKIETLPTTASDEIQTNGRASLDDGDSGGGAYAIDPDDRRYLVAVNSQRTDGPISRIASLSSPRAIRFITAWRSRHPDALICGVDSSLTNCKY